MIQRGYFEPSIEQDLESLRYEPAMEMTKDELLDIIGGRKEFFNKFYPQIVNTMGAGTPRLMRAIAQYRDKNIEILSSPYMLNYTIFGNQDQQIIWDITKIDEDEVAKEIPQQTKKLFIIQSTPVDVVETFVEKFKSMGIEEVYITNAGPSICIHCGENTVGVVYID